MRDEEPLFYPFAVFWDSISSGRSSHVPGETSILTGIPRIKETKYSQIGLHFLIRDLSKHNNKGNVSTGRENTNIFAAIAKITVIHRKLFSL